MPQQCDRLPLFFTHYGMTDYLHATLAQAKRSNPSKRCVLLGDSANKDVALSHGWEHTSLRSLTSPKRDEFNARFRWVQGRHHNPIKGGHDWLRYVSERFYALEAFVTREGVSAFWHFDSDTMILHDLEAYEPRIQELSLSCTTQCNGLCPSGLLTGEMLAEYCDSMIDDYKDERFLSSQQKEFDETNPGYAFTEMRAFRRYCVKTHPLTRPLSSLFADRGVWFDDCICQEHGFEFVWAHMLRRNVKNFYSCTSGVCARKKDGVPFVFATVNCSWVPIQVFDWVARAGACRTADCPPHLRNVLRYGLWGRVCALAKKTARNVIFTFRSILYSQPNSQ